MSQQTVLIIIDDLFFLSKVQTTLDHLGLAAKVMTDPTALQAYMQDATPRLAVVDLTLRTCDAVSCIRTMRATHREPTVPILAFGSHVDVETRQQALQAGADQVVVKSEFSKRLSDFIRHYTG